MNKILSIVIPTKNRSHVLHNSILTIISQPFFALCDEVEIVVSDNASTDDTKEIVQKFIDIFPDKIKYYCNEIDILDKNFECAMRRGQGEYIKLANDSLKWAPGSLEQLFNIVKASISLKPFIFVLNGHGKSLDPIIYTHNLADFMMIVSHFVTWIGGFGLWRTQLEEISDFSRSSDLKLVQVDMTLAQLSKKPLAIIINNNYFGVMDVGRKGGYSLSQVFGENFLYLLKKYPKLIPDDVLYEVKRKTLLELILPWYYNSEHDFNLFPLEEGLKDYANEPYYKPALRDAADHATAVKQAYDPRVIIDVWRQRNTHNETYLTRICDIERITVGRYSYGPITVWDWGASNEWLRIGHYVSIANDVTFLLGGNHPYRSLTTFPVKVKFLDHQREATSKGPIDIRDDVWIGHSATILSGVTIHQGAIVAACSVVTTDVPAYAIVAGNPARVVKYRFDDPIRNLLNLVNYAKVEPQDLVALEDLGIDDLTKIGIADVSKIVNTLSGNRALEPKV